MQLMIFISVDCSLGTSLLYPVAHFLQLIQLQFRTPLRLMCLVVVSRFLPIGHIITPLRDTSDLTVKKKSLTQITNEGYCSKSQKILKQMKPQEVNRTHKFWCKCQRRRDLRWNFSLQLSRKKRQKTKEEMVITAAHCQLHSSLSCLMSRSCDINSISFSISSELVLSCFLAFFLVKVISHFPSLGSCFTGKKDLIFLSLNPGCDSSPVSSFAQIDSRLGNTIQ